MPDTRSSIVSHYGSNGLVHRIMRALAEAGLDTTKLTVESLNQIDQLHGGGLNSTKFQAELAGINKDTRP